MTFRVEFSAAAERDADSILEWLISVAYTPSPTAVPLMVKPVLPAIAHQIAK